MAGSKGDGMSWRTCDTCHWGKWHEGSLGAPHLGLAPEPGYITCEIDGIVQMLDSQQGDEMACWMPPLDAMIEESNE